MWFPIPGPKGEDVYPIRNDGSEGRWRYGKTRMMQFVRDQNIEFVKRPDGTYIAYEKIRSTDPRQKPYRTWLTDTGSTADSSKTVKFLFEERKVFDFPKPVSLIKHLIAIGGCDDEDMVLDFFAGSSSMAQAVLEFNASQEQSLRFICVQIPEPTDSNSEAHKAGYRTIADIGKERIRRVAARIKQEQEANKDLFSAGQAAPDLGFRVFKLQKSNFRLWDAGVAKTPEAVQQQLELHVEHLAPEAQQEAVLYELLLKSGFELATPVERLSLPLGGGREGVVYSVAEGELLICLEKQLTQELLQAMAERAPARVVCLDAGFQDNDQLKTNAVLLMKSKGVVTFRTV